jgi:hypothetical protein
MNTASNAGLIKKSLSNITLVQDRFSARVEERLSEVVW